MPGPNGPRIQSDEVSGEVGGRRSDHPAVRPKDLDAEWFLQLNDQVEVRRGRIRIDLDETIRLILDAKCIGIVQSWWQQTE